MIDSKRCLFAMVLSMTLIFGAAQAFAEYPDHPVHMVVGQAPGGGADNLARLIAPKLSEKWHQTVLVENRTGADGAIAADYVAHAAPDGYTIMEASSTFMVESTPELKLNYDPIKSFAPMILLTTHPDALVVNKTVPVNSVKELLDLARAKPGEINYGSAGLTSPAFQNMRLLLNRAGVNMTNISYKGNGPALVALLGNEIQVMFAGPTGIIEQVKSGQLKPLAVSSNVRLPLMPDVPTIPEATGLKFDDASNSWNGVFGPTGTSPAIIKKIHDDVVEVLNLPDVQQRLKDQGFVTLAGPTNQFADFLKEDFAQRVAMMRSIGTK